MKLYVVRATNLKSTNQYINTVQIKFTDKRKAESAARKLRDKGFKIKAYSNTRKIETNVDDAVAFVVDQIGE
jgi:hypothetical protein